MLGANLSGQADLLGSFSHFMRDSAMPIDPSDIQQKPSEPPSVVGAEVSAIFSNQIYFSIFGGMARIAFGEVVFGGGDKVYPRVAIAMPPDRAVELATTILRIYQEAKSKVPSPASPSAPYVG